MNVIHAPASRRDALAAALVAARQQHADPSAGRARSVHGQRYARPAYLVAPPSLRFRLS